ncbi:MAG: CBS domain-containing protein [Candidatus Omnitrophica bacterium]|nr:CBS domain-containing protein [Candidatus Omnitrophota bacterium]
MLVKDIMTREVLSVKKTASLKEVGEILKSKRISGLPVVDEENRIVGIITLTDMLRILDRIYKWKELEKFEPEISFGGMFEKEKTDSVVSDFMTKDVFSLSEDDPLEEVMKLMFSKGVHTLPVTKGGKLIGVVGKRDLVYSCF